MRALIDGDILLYEIGFSSESVEVVDGEKVVVPRDWEFCQGLFDKKIDLIVDEVGATEPPLLFFTNTVRINKLLNKRRLWADELPKSYVDNFRYAAAVEKDYKGGRKETKPFHFHNILAYALGTYSCHVDENGLEADDAMAIMQYAELATKTTTICSRDKDLRQCPGWHYSWECGKQASIGPMWVDELGWLKKDPKKIWGTGEKFFYFQLLTGDAVDNIGGIKNIGPITAYNMLWDAPTVVECYNRVSKVYQDKWKDEWKSKFREQADLLYIIRQLDEQGEKVKWKPPKM